MLTTMFDSLRIIINKNFTIIEGNYYRRHYWELVEDGKLMIWKGQSNIFFLRERRSDSSFMQYLYRCYNDENI